MNPKKQGFLLMFTPPCYRHSSLLVGAEIDVKKTSGRFAGAFLAQF
jgi:hypothetical protein